MRGLYLSRLTSSAVRTCRGQQLRQPQSFARNGHTAVPTGGGRSLASKVWALPAVPEAVREAVGGAIADALVPSEAVLVDTREDAEALLPQLLALRLLGLDCEGVALGRWGRCCLIQVATPERVYLFDTLRRGVGEAIRPVLDSSSITKIMHDCREDASALLSQFDSTLVGVFDTQVAHTMLLERECARPFQISLNELLKNKLAMENEQQVEAGKRMREDPNIWFYRPLQQELVAYAAQDAMYLPLLHRQLCEALEDPSGSSVMMRSKRYVDYARMNLHLSSPKAAERHGLRLQAMVATRTDAALYLKLNLGGHRQGVVSRPESLSSFEDLQFGDIADCWVSAWNTTGSIIFLERVETTSPQPDPGRRPAPLFGRPGRRRPLGSHFD